ncbi:hypothetical protein Tco_0516177 [Tanacetum coccineum]
MQGRITKVLNMKPIETLSMLEEAAGTRMYERKKDVALKTLVKKQGKVDMINRLLDNEILPALEKLRTEYMQWSNGNAKLDRLKRCKYGWEVKRLSDRVDAIACDLNKDVSRLENEEEDLATKKNNVDEVK